MLRALNRLSKQPSIPSFARHPTPCGDALPHASARPLHLAAAGRQLNVMNELLESGADIDAQTKGGCGCKFDFSNIILCLLHTR